MRKTILYVCAAAASFMVSCCSCNPAKDSGGTSRQGGYYPKKEGTTRIVTYNVGVFSKYTDDSSGMIAGMMKEIDADAVLLNEVDRNTERNPYDQISRFAGHMGWKYAYAPAMPYKGGEYGIGLVYGNGKASTLVESFSIPLKKKSGGEDRVCIVAEFSDFVLAGTHLEVSSEEDRLSGVRTITSELKARYGGGSKPVFLCGDMNARPESEVIKALERDWHRISPLENSHSSTRPDKCIDYIFALDGAGRYKVVSSGVCTRFRSGDVRKASDHLPVYADVKIK